MNKAVIGLGSNINPESNIESAKHALTIEFQVLRFSSFLTTKPVGYTQQDDFINGAALISTDLNQETLKDKLKKIENSLGRQRSPIKFGPRTIDLDIIIWNNSVVDQDYFTRDFLRNSVLELIPEFNADKG